MPAFRPSLAVISSLLLCLGLATTTTAQREPAPVTFVTGTVIEAYGYEVDAGARDPFAHDTQGYEIEVGGLGLMRQVVEWSDPRLPPDLWLASDHTLIWRPSNVLDGAINTASRALLEDEQGRWVGTGRWVNDGDEQYSCYALAGEGAYEGIHVLLRGVPVADRNGPWDLAYEGYVFESELTPFPDEPVPMTEGGYQVYPFPSGRPAE